MYSCVVKKLPSSIRELIHLRELDISFTGITELPEWIGELHHLQTLRAERLRKLPSTLKYLISLRQLYIGLLVELPAEIGRLTQLTTLERFRVGNKNGFKIEELGSLNNIKGLLEISKLEMVGGGKEETKKANLCQKSKVSELILTWSTRRKDDTNDENVLEGLQPHPNLKKLVISRFKGKRFPLWTRKVAVQCIPQGSWVGLDKLTNISLWYCSECEEIPMLGHLPNLKSLCLAGLSNVKCISSSFYGLVNEGTPTVFPALERLELSNMPELAEWGEAERGSDEVKVFPRLKHFKIEECCKLMSVPTHFSSSRLQRLEILDTGLSDCLFSSYSNLSKLDIRGCPNLTKVPDCVRTLSSLEELNIAHCLNLETVAEEPSERQSQSEGNCSFTSLRILKIYLCPALVYFPCEMIGSSLENLSLDSLSSLENLPSLIDRLPNLPRLTFLEIVCVPKFMPSSSSLETWPLCSLKSINLNVSTGASMETVDAILQGCRHSLKWLRLTGMEIWKCLPQSIRHLTALHELTLENFGMEELPEWLGDLSSLRQLRLYNCKNLRHLPSMDAMRRLTRLEQLEVDGCTELRLTRSDETGSEWSKISHIPDIRLLFTPVWL